MQKNMQAYYTMEFTGRTDQFRGREYECKNCGAKRWSCFGNARQHPKHCEETDSENWRADE